MSENVYSTYLSPTGKLLQVCETSWMDNDSQHSYLTADESSNNTQYFSMLDTSTETIMNDMSQISLDNNQYIFENCGQAASSQDEIQVIEEISDEPDEDEEQENDTQNVVIFKTPFSDTWLGLHIVQDDEGNLIKYQYELLQHEDGQFETIPETIQIVPFDTDPETVTRSVEAQLKAAEEESIICKTEPHAIKQEFLGFGLAGEEPEDEETMDIKPDVHKIVAKQESHALFSPEDSFHSPLNDQTETEEDFDDESALLIQSPVQSSVDEESTEYVININPEDKEEEMEMPEVKHGILESALQGIYSPTKTSGEERVETIQFLLRASSGETQQLYAEMPPQETTKEVEAAPEWPQLVKKTIALYPDPNEMRSNQPTTITTIDVPANPRSKPPFSESIFRKVSHPPLKSSNSLLDVQQQHKQFTGVLKTDAYTQKENVQEAAQLKVVNVDRKAAAARKLLDDNPTKTDTPKKHVQVPAWTVYRQILQTKIVEAPVRQERLPRKQKLQIPNRGSEELVFQHVVVQSNGMVETKVDGVVKKREVLQPTDWVQLSDDEEYPRKSRKRSAKRKHVEIVISDSDDESDDDSEQSDEDAENDDNSVVKPSIKEEAPQHQCTKCTKTFPSSGSLKTHLQHHTLEESKQQSIKNQSQKKGQGGKTVSYENVKKIVEMERRRVYPGKCLAIGQQKQREENKPVAEETKSAKVANKMNNGGKIPQRKQSVLSKYACEECGETFINLFLQRKHSEQHRSRNKHECHVCKKLFANAAQLNAHSKCHVKKSLFESISSVGPIEERKKKIVASPKTCYTCQATFESKLELEEHVLRKCVKLKSSVKSKESLPAASSSLNTPSMLRATPRDKSKRWRRDTGIPIFGKMREAFDELQKQMQEDAAAEKEEV